MTGFGVPKSRSRESIGPFLRWRVLGGRRGGGGDGASGSPFCSATDRRGALVVGRDRRGAILVRDDDLDAEGRERVELGGRRGSIGHERPDPVRGAHDDGRAVAPSFDPSAMTIDPVAPLDGDALDLGFVIVELGRGPTGRVSAGRAEDGDVEAVPRQGRRRRPAPTQLSSSLPDDRRPGRRRAIGRVPSRLAIGSEPVTTVSSGRAGR